MTYEEYKSKKNISKSNNIFKRLLNKLFTIVIFTMLIIIISNYSPKFRNFIINDVLNDTMDFSKVNKVINKFTDIFKINKNKTVPVIKMENEKSEKYLDGVKYYINENENIYVKDSGIVTYIGNKEGYNNTVIIQQSNGYYAWYGNIKENIKMYDYVEKGSILGTASKEYYYALFKDDKSVSIDES